MSTKFRDNLLTFIFLLMYLYKYAIHYVLSYANLYLLFDCNLHKAESLIINLFNLKSI